MARHEPQRPPLARAADEDRHALLQRPRVAGRRLDRRRAALEARRARAPHQRQQLERVLEAGVALAQRREVPAVEAVLALEPGGAEAAHRAAAGEHVERRDDLRQVGDVAVRDAGDERARGGSARHAGEVAERRVALEHVLPLAPDLRDLEDVVHDPEAREAGLLGGARDGRRARPRSSAGCPASRSGRPAARSRSVIGSSCWRTAACGAVRNAGGTSVDGPGAVDTGEALGGERARRRRLGLAQLAGDDLRRDRARRARGCAGGRRRRAGRRRRRRPARRGARPAPATRRGGALEAGRVDHGRQPAPQPLGTMRSRTSNASRLARTSRSPVPDDGAQPVRRDDLVGVEPRGGPVRLAGRRRADENDEARDRAGASRASYHAAARYTCGMDGVPALRAVSDAVLAVAARALGRRGAAAARRRRARAGRRALRGARDPRRRRRLPPLPRRPA